MSKVFPAILPLVSTVDPGSPVQYELGTIMVAVSRLCHDRSSGRESRRMHSKAYLHELLPA